MKRHIISSVALSMVDILISLYERNTPSSNQPSFIYIITVLYLKGFCGRLEFQDQCVGDELAGGINDFTDNGSAFGKRL